MTLRSWLSGALIGTFATLAAAPASAASLQMVSDWGATGVPTYIAMYIYVPDKLATKPPILVVSHYCSGDAAGVFNEAKTGGIVAAADTYGFIMIFPQNHLPGTTRNCWDVATMASLTHDGGGDTQAIAEMVRYTITKYHANANRVYATGTSSGAMMTQALLAVYPDIFKAGAEFAGVPAGCWSASYDPTMQWSGPCAMGQVTHTAQEWGDMVRAMNKGYTGMRPRIQLWHGLSDPIIYPANLTEGIKQWTNLLALSSTPTATATVSIGGHQYMRQEWKAACGIDVLDTWAEVSGGHGTDANLNAQYVIPFLGLDKTGDVDPYVAMCSPGGPGGASGGGGGAGSHATAGSGGALGQGGSAGAAGTGGMPRATGGAAGAPIVGAGGAAGDGSSGSGGIATATGGTVATGGVNGTGGAGTSGASGSNATGGQSSGCSCAVSDPASGRGFLVSALLLALALIGHRRRRHRRWRP